MTTDAFASLRAKVEALTRLTQDEDRDLIDTPNGWLVERKEVLKLIDEAARAAEEDTKADIKQFLSEHHIQDLNRLPRGKELEARED